VRKADGDRYAQYMNCTDRTSCLAQVQSDKIVAKLVGINLEMKVSSSRAIIQMSA
jgi:hypothetical protein